VQAAVIDRVTTEIYDRLRVEAITDRAVQELESRGLSPQTAAALTALSGPLANGVRGFIETQVRRFITSEEFQQAWVNANRVAHEQLVAVLTGETGEAVQVSGNAVKVNLAAVINAVKERLENAGFGLASRIPEVNAEFTIMQSDDLTKAQTAFRLLSNVAILLPILGLVLIAAAVAISRSRRRALIGAALAVAASMIVLGLVLNVFRALYLDAVPTDEVPTSAAAAIYDNLAYFIRLTLRAVLVFALTVAFVAWVSGNEPAPVAVRRGFGRFLDGVRHRSDSAGLDTGRVGELAWTYRTPIRVAVLGAAVLLYVLADYPTGGWTLGVVAVAGVVLLVVELIARRPAAEEQLAHPLTPGGPSDP
jgi:hypothetical protein